MAKLWCALLCAVALRSCVSAWTLADIRLPPGGFQVQYFSRAVPNARSMALSTGATEVNLVYVSTRSRRNIYAVIDENKDGVADAVHTLVDNLATPNGIAYLNGALFVAQVNRVLRFDGVDAYALRGEALPAPAVVSTAFPSDGSHGWKYIAFSPADGKLYVPVGAPCNICEMQAYGSIGYGTINRMNADGSQLEVFASGIRNTVGFDWHPVTGELWFTDNGRDNMGDDFPDCELNVVPTAGMFFGYPYCHTAGRGPPEERTVGVGLPLNDPQLNADSRVQCELEDSHVRAVQALGPHTAPLGMKFYTGAMFPGEYRNAAFVAEHGSWNRAEKIGYRVSVVHTDANGTVTSRATFADGWLQGQSSYGRPVDVLQLPDGSLLVSDDDAGAIYRISYGEGNPPPATSPPPPPPPLRSPPPPTPPLRPALARHLPLPPSPPPSPPSPSPPPPTPSHLPPAALPPPPPPSDSANPVPTKPWPPPIAAATLSPTSAAAPTFEPTPGPPGGSLAEQKAIPSSATSRVMVVSMLAALFLAQEY